MFNSFTPLFLILTIINLIRVYKSYKHELDQENYNLSEKNQSRFIDAFDAMFNLNSKEDLNEKFDKQNPMSLKNVSILKNDSWIIGYKNQENNSIIKVDELSNDSLGRKLNINQNLTEILKVADTNQNFTLNSTTTLNFDENIKNLNDSIPQVINTNKSTENNTNPIDFDSENTKQLKIALNDNVNISSKTNFTKINFILLTTSNSSAVKNESKQKFNVSDLIEFGNATNKLNETKLTQKLSESIHFVNVSQHEVLEFKKKDENYINVKNDEITEFKNDTFIEKINDTQKNNTNLIVNSDLTLDDLSNIHLNKTFINKNTTIISKNFTKPFSSAHILNATDNLIFDNGYNSINFSDKNVDAFSNSEPIKNITNLNLFIKNTTITDLTSNTNETTHDENFSYIKFPNNQDNSTIYKSFTFSDNDLIEKGNDLKVINSTGIDHKVNELDASSTKSIKLLNYTKHSKLVVPNNSLEGNFTVHVNTINLNLNESNRNFTSNHTNVLNTPIVLTSLNVSNFDVSNFSNVLNTIHAKTTISVDESNETIFNTTNVDVDVAIKITNVDEKFNTTFAEDKVTKNLKNENMDNSVYKDIVRKKLLIDSVTTTLKPPPSNDSSLIPKTYFSTQGIVGIVLSLLLVLCILIAIIFMKRNNDNGKYSPAKYENRGLPSYAMIVVPPEQRLI